MNTTGSAVAGVSKYLHVLWNRPDPRTGFGKWVGIGESLMGKPLPPVLLEYLKLQQVSIFGGFPDSKDVAPSLVFAAIFAILGILHLIIFGMNFSRQHYFYLSIGLVAYCMMRVISFVVRVFWSEDFTSINLGMVSEVFLVIPSVFLVGLNLILAGRIFTWRHPIAGSSPTFSGVMVGLDIIVGLIVAISIFCLVIPNYYLLSTTVSTHYYNGVEASSILLLLYSLTAVVVLLLAFLFVPKKDDDLYTYQPWWIESFSPFYFVDRGAKANAEESFMKRGWNHRNAIRIIASTHNYSNVVQDFQSKSKSKSKSKSNNNTSILTHNLSLFIIVISTILIFIGSSFHCIVVFDAKTVRNSINLAKPLVMYICFGVFEVVINLLYIIGRVDLRFYRPDCLPRRIRDVSAIEYLVNVTMNNPTPIESQICLQDSIPITILDSTDTGQFYSPGIGTESRFSIEGRMSELSFDSEKCTAPSVPTHTRTSTIIKMYQDEDTDEFRF